MNGSSSLPFSSLPGLGDDELPGFSAEECPEEMPDLSKHFSLAAEVLKADRNLYQQMRRKQTSSGVRFAKCIKTGMDNRGHPMIKALGAVAGDAECYDTFRPFFDRLLALCHGEEVLNIQHGYCPARSVAALEPDNVVSCHLRASRNLKDVPFVPHMARAQRSEVERRIVLLLKDFGSYFPLVGSTSFAAKPKGMDAAEEKMLLDSGLLFREPDSPAVLSTGGGRHWPEGRGVFVLEPKDDSSAMTAWINEEEHFKIMVDRKDGNLKQCLLDANRVLRLLESSYGFEQTQRLGYLTSSPMNLGIAMVASYVLRLPKLMEAKKELVDWCKSRDVIARGVLDEQGLRVEGLLEISHRQKIGIRAEDMVAELSQEAAFLCRAEALVVKDNMEVQDALDVVKPRELTPIGVEDEEALALDAWAFSGDHLGMLISNAMVLEEVEAAKVKLGQTLMAGTLGSELANRAAAWQEEREEEFERQKAEAAVRIQAIQRGRAERKNKAKEEVPKVSQEVTPEALEARKAMLREALEASLNDGTLEQVLMDCSPKASAPNQAEDLRLKARDTLTASVTNGRLDDIIKDKEEELRNKIGQQLLLAADDGRLETILADNMKPMKSDLNELRKCFADELLSASADGRLDTILQAQNQAVSEKDRQEMGELLLRAAEDGSLEKALQSKAAAFADGLRSQVGAKLLAAAEDGSLERIMREKAAASVDGLRSQVGARLLAAAEDGSLERIMQEKADTAAQQLRERMGQSLIAASRDGRLEDALRQHKGPTGPTSLDRMESVRQRTAAKLLAAAEDGRLDRVLANNDNLDSVRQQLAATFLAFAEDGRLERVLSRTSDMDVLRQRVSAQMLAAAEDGRLDVAMQKKDQAQKDLVRGKAAASLLKAAEDGQLESMLAKGNLEDIRSRMAASMSEAAETGRLEEVLRGSKVQEIRMEATMVPWSDVVPDEIRSTDLIAQAHLAAQGQLKIGAQAAQSTLLRYERRIGTLMANIHQAERESLSKSAEAASLEVALQEAVLELRRVEQDLESQKVLMGNEEVRAMQLQDRQRQLIDQLDQETLKVKHARIEWRGVHELAGQ